MQQLTGELESNYIAFASFQPGLFVFMFVTYFMSMHIKCLIISLLKEISSQATLIIRSVTLCYDSKLESH